MSVIRKKIKPDSIVYADRYRSYNALDVSEFKHYHINHSELFVTNIITSMESKILTFLLKFQLSHHLYC